MRDAAPGDWVFSVIRRTWVRVVVVAVVFAIGGAVIQHLAPGSTTMGEALRNDGRCATGQP